MVSGAKCVQISVAQRKSYFRCHKPCDRKHSHLHISWLWRKTSRTKNRVKSISSFQEFSEALLDFIRANSLESAAELHSAETRGHSNSASQNQSAPTCNLPSSTRQHVDAAFNETALALFALQFSAVGPYRKFCEARKVSPASITHWTQIPALPTSTFNELEISSLKPEQRTHVFHSSGTTEQTPSRHFHNADSLGIYEASLLPWFQKHFLADWDELQENEVVGPIDKPGMIFLTPSPALAPNSSLVHMFETVRGEFGSRDSLFTGKLDEQNAWSLDIDQTLFALRKSMCANRPVCILGTAFSFVHLLDHFAANNIRYRLAEGSRVLETGGYKGRSRSLPKADLHELITKHLGIPASHVVCEYGMSELSSQAYDREVPSLKFKVQSSRVLRFPPWARVQIISPETGKEVGEGETGLVRIFDLANVYSVLAIQTEDLGIRLGEGFELIGRTQLAEPRGCSLMTIG
jgi:hypothetical protein